MPKPSDSGFIQEVPSAVMIKFMFYIQLFEYFISLAIRCQYRNLTKDNLKPEFTSSQPLTLFACLQFALLYN